MEWTQTRSVLMELCNLLTCTICKGFLNDPCTLDNCDHNFCRKCIEESLDRESKCPKCGLFSWIKDLRVNHQLATTVNMTLKLQNLIGLNMEGKYFEPQVEGDSEPEVDSNSESLENTFSFGSDNDVPVEDGDQEVSDDNCDEEQKSSSGAESVDNIKPDTNTSESDRVRESRQTVKGTTKLRTKPLTSGSVENDDITKTAGPKQPSVTIPRCTDTESEKEHKNNTKQPNFAVQDETKFDSEPNNPSLANEIKLVTGKHKKIAEQPSATVQNDTESDSMANNASLAETTSNVKQHVKVKKHATKKHKDTSEQSSAIFQNNTESDSDQASNASIAEITANVKRHMNVRKLATRKHEKITRQLRTWDNTESDSESDNSTIMAEATSNVKQVTTTGRKLRSKRQNNKIAKRPGVTLHNDGESDSKTNNAYTAETTKYGKQHNNLRKPTTGTQNNTAEKTSLPPQNDTESDSGPNNADTAETTANVKQHTCTNVRKRATRRHSEIAEKPSSEESDSDAETTTESKKLKRRNKSKLNGRHSNGTGQKGSRDSSTESISEACHTSLVTTTTRRTNVELSLNARKATITTHENTRKQLTLLNSATDSVATATTKIRRSFRENPSKSRSSTASLNYLNGDAESNCKTNEDIPKENTNPKQRSDVRRSTKGDERLSQQPEVENTQSNIKANEIKEIKCTSEVREPAIMSENTIMTESNLTSVKKSSHMTKASRNTTSARQFAQTRKKCDKKQIRIKKKRSSSEKPDRNASKQNVHKTFTNKLNPTSKTDSNLIGNPFDFTQQEDPFHFSFTEDDNGYHHDNNNENDHDNDKIDIENYGDHENGDDDVVHHLDEDNHNNDDDKGHDDHVKNDGSNKRFLRSKYKFVKNMYPQDRKTREKSNPFENGRNGNTENDNEILQNTKSVNTRWRNKINPDVVAEQTKRKVQFTHLKDRSTSHDQSDQIEVEKDKKTSRSGLKHNPKVVCTEDKENVTLNIKRGRVRRKRHSILPYLIDTHPKNSPENSSDDDESVPQKRRKSRNPTTSSSLSLSQSSQNAACSSQKTRNKKGETPLHLAAIKGDFALANELINDGADPNVKDYAGWTPLHEACNHGHVDIVKLFLDHNALINIPGLDNDTPLHDAVANGRLKVVNLLVARGAVLTARNKQGLLPMDYAVTKAMKAALTPRDVSSSTTPLENLENVKRTMESCQESQVILGTALRTQDKVTLKKCVRQLGGTLVDEFDESVTHVVTSVNDNGHCPRTIKYLSGILTGKWIVGFKWIKDSLRQRQWLDEDGYEVEGTAGTTCNVARKARLNILQQMPRLLDGCSFFLRGVFNPPTPDKQDLIKLIQLGGGKLLHREPRVKDDDLTSFPSSPIVTSISRAPEVAYHAPANSTLSCCTEFILYDSVSCDQPKIVCSPVLRTAPVTWLMDCISSFQLLDIPEAN